MTRSFEDRAEHARPDALDQGQLTAGLVVEGTLSGRADLRLEGAFRGAVDIDASVTVGPQAQLTGPVRARRIDVSGEVVGDLAASHVTLRAGAWVSGDVRASTIAIDDGATLEGLVDMDFDAAARGPRRSR